MTHFPLPLGTLANTLTVILGSLLGILIHKGVKGEVQKILFSAIGLFTLGVAVTMCIEMENPITIILSLGIGTVIGQTLRLEERFEARVDKIKERFSKEGGASPHFTTGLLTAFLLFCIGPMTVIGAIDEGIRSDHTLLLMKAVLDGIASVSLAGVYGWGIFFSFIPLFLFQIALTLLAWIFQDIFSASLISQMTALGGILMFGVGLSLLELKKIKLMNLLPSILILILLTILLEQSGISFV